MKHLLVGVWKTKSKIFVLPLEQDGEISGPAYIPVMHTRNFQVSGKIIPSGVRQVAGFSDMQCMKFCDFFRSPKLLMFYHPDKEQAPERVNFDVECVHRVSGQKVAYLI